MGLSNFMDFLDLTIVIRHVKKDMMVQELETTAMTQIGAVYRQNLIETLNQDMC